ncbi:MAG: hydrogenase nickel incorporation protein HypA [Thermoproteota archaeon]
MHEWALAEAIVKTASRISEEKGFEKVKEVRIKIGELQQIERDILEFALLRLRSAKFEDAKFTIEVARTELKCRACGCKWFFEKEKLDENIREAIHFVPEVSHAYVKCPKCGSPDFEIIGGGGVWLESIEKYLNS